jgi:hypothetical protein
MKMILRILRRAFHHGIIVMLKLYILKPIYIADKNIP